MPAIFSEQRGDPFKRGYLMRPRHKPLTTADDGEPWYPAISVRSSGVPRPRFRQKSPGRPGL